MKLMVGLSILILLAGCTEKEYVYLDVAPQLEITITGPPGNPIAGATVSLYISEENFREQKNAVHIKTTSEAGRVVFEELSEMIYYFFAEKGELNNYYEVVTFANPLRKNEIKKITCIIR